MNQHRAYHSSRIAFVVMLAATLAQYTVSAPAQEIELVAHFDPMPGTAYSDVWGEGNYAYLATQDNGVFIVDISSPDNPQLAAHYLPGQIPYQNFQDVKVANGIGYFASCSGDGLHIVDLSDPSSPVLLTRITSVDGGFSSVHNVSVSGKFLYEADGGGRDVHVFDVSTPASPQFVRTIRSGGRAGIHDMTALGDRLYTSDISVGRTVIYDVTSMSTSVAPIRLGRLITGSNTHSNWVTEDGNVLASARECDAPTCGVNLFDISDPANPISLAQILEADLGFDASSPHNPLIMDDFLYVSWYEAGLQVFDISDPTNPVRVGSYDTYSGPGFGLQGNWGVYPFLGKDRVLLSDRDSGLYIVDVSAVVPEPGTMTLAAIGLLGVLMYVRRSTASGK